MITKQAEQEKKSDLCYSNPVYQEGQVLKLKNLKGLGCVLHYIILLRYSRGWYYLTIKHRKSTNTEKGGISR